MQRCFQEIPADDRLLAWFRHLLPLMTDVHCHLQDNFTMETAVLLKKIQLKRCLVMGTRPEDWTLVRDICEGWNGGNGVDELVGSQVKTVDEEGQIPRTQLVPCYGCHPWFAHTCTETPESKTTCLFLHKRQKHQKSPLNQCYQWFWVRLGWTR